jgi:hypothetical protein
MFKTALFSMSLFPCHAVSDKRIRGTVIHSVTPFQLSDGVADVLAVTVYVCSSSVSAYQWHVVSFSSIIHRCIAYSNQTSAFTVALPLVSVVVCASARENTSEFLCLHLLCGYQNSQPHCPLHLLS